MPEHQRGKQPPRARPGVSKDNATERPPPSGNTGVRGDALTAGGNKIHGDKLEGMIPGKPEPRSDRSAVRSPDDKGSADR